MTESTAPALTVIAPGSGSSGSRVARRLIASGASVRAVSRSSSPAFDWTAPATWPRTFAGADAAYLAFVPDLAVPGSADVLSAVGAAARDAGISRLVLLSGRGESEAAAAEDSLRSAAVPTAVLRADWFAQNFTDGFLAECIIDGVLSLPVGDVREPFVDLDDVADAAVAVLLAADPVDGTFELSGPESLTFGEAANLLAVRAGRPVEFRSITPDRFDAQLTEFGVPEDQRRLLGYLFREVLDGRNSAPTDGVAHLLGRGPTSLASVFAR